MDSTVKIDHEKDSLNEAIGISEERAKELYLERMKTILLDTEGRISVIIEQTIEKCNTPEELAYQMFHIGKLVKAASVKTGGLDSLIAKIMGGE